MSNTDSFIEEVTEEVQRDKLIAFLKKWGWLAGLVVLLIVGGAGFNEWRKANERTQAQAFGDALLSAIEADDAGESLSVVEPSNPAQAALIGHLAAADAISGDNPDTIAQALASAEAPEAPPIYTELAKFKAALALPPETALADRRAAFEALAAPGAPFQPLAQEQLALILVEEGKSDEAITLLRSILDGSQVTAGLQRRASELIVALGGELVDTSG